ncbi:SET and MYND domain-containing protein 3 [Nephila pilipes]|uniref:SET and MYND domain-containing protein 3 n=1 Tax=Nephila pilipes TaxID=299642 RepID=A0A8X6UBN6_NEPPI|nr:SET and MYND domain-containing protein 3 [Nephila pilipes]
MAASDQFYQPGDVLYEGKPFMRVIKKDMWGKICSCCFSRHYESRLKFCKACGIMKYCGKDCQKTDWQYHKFECGVLRRCCDNSWPNFSQLLGNIILKINKRNWKTISEKVLNENVSFDDFQISKQVREENSPEHFSYSVFASNVKTLLIAYIGEENVPDEIQFSDLLGKVLSNHVLCRQDISASIYIG